MKDVSLIVYATADVAAAKRVFTALFGSDPYVDSPQYTGYKADGMTEIGLVSKRGSESTAIAYWDVDDIKATVQMLLDAGGTIGQEVTDVGYGMLVASVKSAEGVTVGLRQQPKG